MKDMCSISVGQVALIYWPSNTEPASQICTDSIGSACGNIKSARQVIATTNMIKQTAIIGWGTGDGAGKFC
jgi:hypothetical protein